MGSPYYRSTPSISPATSWRLPSGRGFEGWANSNVQGGFDAWKQRQFSSAPFSGADDQMSYQPGQRVGFNPGGGGSGSWADRLRNEADPRSITSSPAFQKLLGMGDSTAATDAAKGTIDPALAKLMAYLDAADPLGNANAGALIRQKGTSELRSAERGARRRLDESFGGVHSTADPASLSFMRELMKVGAAEGLGDVERSAQEADMSAKRATTEFRSGIARSIADLGLGQGQLALGQQESNRNAVSGAVTAESYARNTWADVFSRLLSASMNGGSGGKRPIRGYDARGRPQYDDNPFPSMDSFGSHFFGMPPDETYPSSAVR